MGIKSDIEFLTSQPDCHLNISCDKRWLVVFVRDHGPDSVTKNFAVEEAYVYGDTLSAALIELRKKVNLKSKNKKNSSSIKRAPQIVVTYQKTEEKEVLGICESYIEAVSMAATYLSCLVNNDEIEKEDLGGLTYEEAVVVWNKLTEGEEDFVFECVG